MTQSFNIRERFILEMANREEQAEKLACLIWIVVILLTYAFFLVSSSSLSPELVKYISILVALMLPAFIGVFLLIQFGRFHPVLTFVNSFLQISLVSGAIFFDALVYGTEYAMSSMPPLAYGLVIVVTAFRMRPAMGLFSGSLAALQFALLYAYMRYLDPQWNEALVTEIPSLSWSVTAMKLVILLAMGFACSFTAVRLRKELQNFLVSANTEMRLTQSLGRYVSEAVSYTHLTLPTICSV